VEHTAQITLAAHQLGQVGTLSPEAVQELIAKRQELLQRQGRDLCQDCSVCLLGDNYQVPAHIRDETTLVQYITQSVLNNLEGEAEKR
jgi:hypothetical protein